MSVSQVLPSGRPPSGAPGRRGNAVRWLVPVLLLVFLGLVALSVLVGAGEIGPGRTLDYLLGRPDALADPQLRTVVTTIRLPRTLVAVIVGCALGVAGALLQAATRNPLAETGLLGVNSGAALFVVVGITYTGAETGYAYLLWAFGGALLASLIVLLIAAAGRTGVSPLRLVLAGAALSATFRGLTSSVLLSRSASYDQYRFWVLGSLSGVTLRTALHVLPAVLIGLVIALVVARPLSALALGDDTATALGHRPAATRLTATVAVTLLAGAAVALAGPIAFLGLVAPYVARAVTGPGMGAQIGLSALVGAVILLAADILARIIVRPFEAPVAVLLALIGGPVLLWIVRSRRMLALNTPEAGS